MPRKDLYDYTTEIMRSLLAANGDDWDMKCVAESALRCAEITLANRQNEARIAQEEIDAERCRRCRYRSDEHDFDGKCPASEDDAAYYRQDHAITT